MKVENYIIAKGVFYGKYVEFKFFINKGKIEYEVISGVYKKDPKGIEEGVMINLKCSADSAPDPMPCYFPDENTLWYIDIALENDFFDNKDFTVEIHGDLYEGIDMYDDTDTEDTIY